MQSSDLQDNLMMTGLSNSINDNSLITSQKQALDQQYCLIKELQAALMKQTSTGQDDDYEILLGKYKEVQGQLLEQKRISSQFSYTAAESAHSAANFKTQLDQLQPEHQKLTMQFNNTSQALFKTQADFNTMKLENSSLVNETLILRQSNDEFITNISELTDSQTLIGQQNFDLKNKISVQKEKLTAVTQANENAQVKIEYIEQNKQQLQKLNDQLSENLSTTYENVKNLQIKLSQVDNELLHTRTENTTLTQALQKLQQQSSRNEEVNGEKLSILLAEHEDLKHRFSALKTTNDQVQDEMTLKTNENQILTLKLEELQIKFADLSSSNANMYQKHQTLIKENEKGQILLNQQSLNITKLTTQNDDKTNQIQALKTENELALKSQKDINIQLQKVQNELNNVQLSSQKEVSSLENSISKQHTIVAQKTQEIKALKQNQDTLKANIQTQNNEFSDLQKAMQTQQNSNFLEIKKLEDAINEKLQEISALNLTISRLQIQTENMAQNTDNLNSNYAKLQQEYDELTEVHKNLNFSLLSQTEEMTNELQKSTSATQNNAMQINNLQLSNQTLTSENQDMKIVIIQLKNEIQHLKEVENELTKTTDKLVILQQLNTQINTQVQLQVLEIQTLNSENESLFNDKENALTKLQILETMIHQQSGDLNILKTQLVLQQQQISNVQQESKEITNQKTLVQQQNEHKTQIISQLESKLSSILNKSSTSVSQLELDALEKNKIINEYEKQEIELKQMIKGQNEKLENHIIQQSLSSKQLDQLNGEVTMLKQSITGKNSSIIDLEKQIQKLENTIISLNSDLNNLKQQLSDKQENNDILLKSNDNISENQKHQLDIQAAQIHEINTHKDELSAKLIDKERYISQIGCEKLEIQNKNSLLQQEMNRKNILIADLELEIEEMKNQIDIAISKSIKYDNSKSILLEFAAEIEEKNLEIQGENLESSMVLQNENDELKSKLNSMEQSLLQQLKEVENSNEIEISNALEIEISELRAQIENLQRQNEMLRTVKSTEKAAGDEFQPELENLQNNLLQTLDELNSTKQLTEILQSEIAENRVSSAALQDKITAFERENSAQKARVEELQQSEARLKGVFHDIKASVKR
ncbi:hypothetical protein SS50377_24942 [Spironucleus salmonicida]|uniref:Uncharacterized protein n=1 Tax=Spironucleus salmonicida TaxID=348837 RepID=V6LG31_9EUKA|nr:hypothetical protein SS50377_24942 [Spironucleus salmonicida]|eukprot:EST43472.1 Hypothetical protein SS50377_16838 [Spironucleus salmonicida]